MTQDLSQAHQHEHDHQAIPSDLALRVKALESLLVEKGLVDRAALDALVDAYEHKLEMAHGWWRGRGQILRTSNGCCAMPMPRLQKWAMAGSKANTWW